MRDVDAMTTYEFLEHRARRLTKPDCGDYATWDVFANEYLRDLLRLTKTDKALLARDERRGLRAANREEQS